MNVLATVAVTAAIGCAQQPTIESVVNAASFAGSVRGRPIVAPGGISSIIGQNLASTERAADPSRQLPYRLEGTTVTVGGIPAPILYVSPGQINFQAPQAIDPYRRTALVIVTTAVGASLPVAADIQDAAPGIFTLDGSGCGPALVYNVHSDGVYTLNTPDQSAAPGNHILLYATGLGIRLGTPPPDGEPGERPSEPPLTPQVLSAQLGLESYRSWALHWVASRRAPEAVGVDRVVLRLPEDVVEGCGVPLKLGYIQGSQRVPVHIARNGGKCANTPRATTGSALWTRTVTYQADAPDGILRETFAANFFAAPENFLLPSSAAIAEPRPETRTCFIAGPSGALASENPRCKDTGLTTLDAGLLTLHAGSANPVTLSPSRGAYSAQLDAGTLTGGILSMTASGSEAIGPFEAIISMPAPLEIETKLTPGTRISQHAPLTVRWKNGPPDAKAELFLISDSKVDSQLPARCAVLASHGELTLEPRSSFTGSPPYSLGMLPGPAAVIIRVTPIIDAQLSFSAPGIGQPGSHKWVHEFHFRDLELVP